MFLPFLHSYVKARNFYHLHNAVLANHLYSHKHMNHCCWYRSRCVYTYLSFDTHQHLQRNLTCKPFWYLSLWSNLQSPVKSMSFLPPIFLFENKAYFEKIFDGVFFIRFFSSDFEEIYIDCSRIKLHFLTYFEIVFWELIFKTWYLNTKLRYFPKALPYIFCSGWANEPKNILHWMLIQNYNKGGWRDI